MGKSKSDGFTYSFYNDLNERLLLMKKHKDGLCNVYKVTEYINHVLLQCKKENISVILGVECVLHKEEFSIKTLLGIGFMQSEVYRLVNLINKGKVV